MNIYYPIHIQVVITNVLLCILALPSGCQVECIEYYKGSYSYLDDNFSVTIDSTGFPDTWSERNVDSIDYSDYLPAIKTSLTIRNASCSNGYVNIKIEKEGDLPADIEVFSSNIGCPGILRGTIDPYFETNIDCIIDVAFVRKNMTIELRMENCEIETSPYASNDGSTIQRVSMTGTITKQLERTCVSR